MKKSTFPPLTTLERLIFWIVAIGFLAGIAQTLTSCNYSVTKLDNGCKYYHYNNSQKYRHTRF